MFEVTLLSPDKSGKVQQNFQTKYKQQRLKICE